MVGNRELQKIVSGEGDVNTGVGEELWPWGCRAWFPQLGF